MTEDTMLKKLQALGEEIEKGAGGHCGPVGVSQLSRLILRSERAEEFVPFLPWVLGDYLKDCRVDQEPVVCAALRANHPDINKSLLPFFSSVMKDYSEKDKSAHQFFYPAHYLAKNGNPDLIEAAKPHFPEALKRMTWYSGNFGNTACAWLDIGGDTKTLIEPLNTILNSQEDDPVGGFLNRSRETKLGLHLCTAGFVRFLNHPGIDESKALREMTYPFAGKMVDDYKGDDCVVVLTAIQGKKTGIFWQPEYECARSIPLGRVSLLRGDFMKGASAIDIAKTAQDLFKQMSKTVPRRDVSALAHRAAKQIGSEYREDYARLAAQRVATKNHDPHQLCPA